MVKQGDIIVGNVRSGFVLLETPRVDTISRILTVLSIKQIGPSLEDETGRKRMVPWQTYELMTLEGGIFVTTQAVVGV